MNWIIENSIFVKQLRNFKGVYLVIEKKISFIYLNSFTYRAIKKIIEKIRVSFRYSMFGRLTELKEINFRDFFGSSKIKAVLLNWFKSLKFQTIRYSRTINFVNRTKEIGKVLWANPFCAGGIIIPIAVIINALAVIIFQKEITFGWLLIRLLLLCTAFLGLFCKRDWSIIKANSSLLRKIQRH